MLSASPRSLPFGVTEEGGHSSFRPQLQDVAYPEWMLRESCEKRTSGTPPPRPTDYQRLPVLLFYFIATMNQTIHETEIFRDLPGAVVERLLDECERLILRRGDTLIRQGDPGDCLYILRGAGGYGSSLNAKMAWGH